MIEFQRATKRQSKLRAALFGPSGAGKTYSALRIASGMAGDKGRIAVIDTEYGSASKYADRFRFDTVHLADRTIGGYIEAMQAARDYDVLIIDSMTHGWQELLQEIDRLANSKYRGNTWAAWSEGTPKQALLVDAMLAFPGHLLATMRSKTAWETGSDRNGRTKPVRVGLAPMQGKGIEYEFDLLLELSVNHTAEVIKDRTGKFQDQIIEMPGEKFGQALAAWLTEGVTPPARPAPGGQLPAADARQGDAVYYNVQHGPGETTPPWADSAPPAAVPVLASLAKLIDEHGIAEEQQAAWCAHFGVANLEDLTQQQVDAIVAKIGQVIDSAKGNRP